MFLKIQALLLPHLLLLLLCLSPCQDHRAHRLPAGRGESEGGEGEGGGEAQGRREESGVGVSGRRQTGEGLFLLLMNLRLVSGGAAQRVSQ